MRTFDFTAPTDHLDVGHSRLAYYRWGQGPDLVFVHGWPLHAATFRHLLPTLSAGFTCHLFDLPGTGRSEWSDAAEIDLEAHARSVATAIDALEIERYALVAHDSGAVVARLVATQHGARVRGLLMSNTEIPGHHPWQVKLFMATSKLPFGKAMFGASLSSRLFRRSNLGFGACFTDPRYAEGEFGDLFLRPLADRRTLAGQMRLLDTLDFATVDGLREAHARIRCPVLMVWGPDDPYFPLEGARDMAGQFPGGARVEVIPGAKLFCHEDHAEAYLAHARPFLEGCFDAKEISVA